MGKSWLLIEAARCLSEDRDKCFGGSQNVENLLADEEPSPSKDREEQRSDATFFYLSQLVIVQRPVRSFQEDGR